MSTQTLQKATDLQQLPGTAYSNSNIASLDAQISKMVKLAVEAQVQKEKILEKTKRSIAIYNSIIESCTVCDASDLQLNPRVKIVDSFLTVMSIDITGTLTRGKKTTDPLITKINSVEARHNSSLYNKTNDAKSPQMPTVVFNLIEFKLKRFDDKIMTGLLQIPLVLNGDEINNIGNSLKVPHIIILDLDAPIFSSINKDKEHAGFRRCTTDDFKEFSSATIKCHKMNGVDLYEPPYIQVPRTTAKSISSSSSDFARSLQVSTDIFTSSNMLRLIKLFSYEMDAAGAAYFILDDMFTYEESLHEEYMRNISNIPEEAKPAVKITPQKISPTTSTAKIVEWVGVERYAKKQKLMKEAAEIAKSKRTSPVAQRTVRPAAEATVAPVSNPQTLLSPGTCSYCHNNVSETYVCPGCGNRICVPHSMITGSGSNEKGWCPRCAGGTAYMNELSALARRS